MQSPPFLRHLAQLMGTNETKLKRSFKAECGTTVYGYLTPRRMQIACDLLKVEVMYRLPDAPGPDCHLAPCGRGHPGRHLEQGGFACPLLSRSPNSG